MLWKFELWSRNSEKVWVNIDEQFRHREQTFRSGSLSRVNIVPDNLRYRRSLYDMIVVKHFFSVYNSYHNPIN